LARSGAWWRQVAVVPHERTQSLALHQGPLARRFGVADLILHTTPGPVSPRVRQIPEVDAWRLFSEEAGRAADARRRSGPEQWMRPVPVQEQMEETDAAADAPVMPAPPSYLEGPHHERS
ncbi:PH domain-containing protein, partial [Arthrobacter sp. EH-1B-1]